MYHMGMYLCGGGYIYFNFDENPEVARNREKKDLPEGKKKKKNVRSTLKEQINAVLHLTPIAITPSGSLFQP